jgi:hypothetical protein
MVFPHKQQASNGCDLVVRERIQKLLNGLDDWARLSNRICRLLAVAGRFPCKYDFED